MESLNARVIAGVNDWLRSGESCWLATVAQTYGSSPRPVGSLFGFNPLRGSLGSLSGGCVEEDLLQSLRTTPIPAQVLPQLLRYGVTLEEQERYALPCGGELHIVLEHLQPDAPTLMHFSELTHALAERLAVVRRLALDSGRMTAEIDRSSTFSFSPSHMLHPLAPAYRLLLVGAGEVARYTAQFAQALEFDVTLCDPRDAFFRNWSLDGVEAVQRLPDDLIRERFQDSQVAILALAHDPRIDDMALLEALTTDAFYVGAMGSLRTSQARRDRLAQLGLTAEQLNRLHAPIGIDIGSKTPAEIAVSVLAHLVAERSKQRQRVSASSEVSQLAAQARSGCGVVQLNRHG